MVWDPAFRSTELETPKPDPWFTRKDLSDGLPLMYNRISVKAGQMIAAAFGRERKVRASQGKDGG